MRGRTRLAYLAETSRRLADSLDYQATLATVAGLALPCFGSWCIVHVLAADASISRVAVIHPDAEKQRRARDYCREHRIDGGDAIVAARVIRTHRSEFATAADAEVMDAGVDATDGDLLRELGAQSFLTVPMRARRRTLGAITFISDDLRRCERADLRFAEDVGRRCGVAIDNARLFSLANEARRAAESARDAASFAAQRASALCDVSVDERREAEAKDREEAAFLTTMSHEFRTPLSAVLGFVGLLNDGLAGPLTPLQRDYLQRIGNASGGLLRLIEEVLTLSQLDAGHGRVRLQEVDLSAIVRDVAEMLQPLVGAKQLALIVDLPEAPIRFATDAGKFRQIVINLAANAVKFTRSGEVRLSMSSDECGAVLRVRDTGEGISADEVERLFEAFAQAGQPGARHARGTGLGLSISRQLTRLMGGDISVESTLGTGSTFTVHLPVVGTRAEQAAERSAAGLGERRASERAGAPADAFRAPEPRS